MGCVLEMRDEEIHRLRREMNDANALRQTLMEKEEELNSCRLNVESIQASLEMKSQMEREMRCKYNEQTLKLKDERKQRKQLTTDNERLTYQMRDMEIVAQGFLDREQQSPSNEGGGVGSSLKATDHQRTSSLPSASTSGRPSSLSVSSKMNQT